MLDISLCYLPPIYFPNGEKACYGSMLLYNFDKDGAVDAGAVFG